MRTVTVGVLSSSSLCRRLSSILAGFSATSRGVFLSSSLILWSIVKFSYNERFIHAVTVLLLLNRTHYWDNCHWWMVVLSQEISYTIAPVISFIGCLLNRGYNSNCVCWSTRLNVVLHLVDFCQPVSAVSGRSGLRSSTRTWPRHCLNWDRFRRTFFRHGCTTDMEPAARKDQESSVTATV